MNASDIIKELTNEIAEHGDGPVYYMHDQEFGLVCAVGEVQFATRLMCGDRPCPGCYEDVEGIYLS